MRFIFVGLMIIAILWLNEQTRSHPQTRYNHVSDRLQHPFDTRLRYRIGEIDTRFGLTHQQLKSLTQQATDIWTQGTGTDFFVYDAQAKLTINLIYDDRQMQSTQRHQQLGEIKQNQQNWADQNQRLQQLKAEIEHINQIIHSKKSQLGAQVQHYNQNIAQTNQYGAMHSSQHQLFLNQHEALQKQTLELQQEIEQYNQKIQQINHQVHQLNQMNQSLNQSIDQFNQRFKAKLFDKAIFNGEKIIIYEFSSTDDLRLTLAHEFGHALGLQHNQDPQALMFATMQKQNLENFKLSAADLALLNSR